MLYGICLICEVTYILGKRPRMVAIAILSSTLPRSLHIIALLCKERYFILHLFSLLLFLTQEFSHPFDNQIKALLETKKQVWMGLPRN